MTNKILGTSGTGVNHVHTETDPTILVHNTVPFENQEAAMAALKQKILHPGEIIVVYYNDPGADDGIASMIATGPLQSGGYNEVYKSAAEIDQLVVYLRGLIDAQDQTAQQWAEQLKVEIMNLVEQARIQLVEDNTALINEAVENLNNKFDSSFGELTIQIDSRLNASLGQFQQDLSTGLSTLSAKVDSIDTDYKTYVDASVQRLRNESNTEDENIRRDVSSAISGLRNEYKNYTDDKFGDVSAALSSIRTDLTHQIDVVDNKYNASINSLRSDLNEEIRDRNEDMARELANEDASLKNYTDQLRRDTSNAISDTSAYLKDYVNTKHDIITEESRREDERIERELTAFINASVAHLSDDVYTYMNDYKQSTDASLAELKTYVD